MFRKVSAPYAPYMQAEPSFDRRNTDAALGDSNISIPAMDIPFYNRLLAYARQSNWGRATLAAAVESPNDAGFDQYFDKFLASRRGRRLLPDLHGLSATFRVVPKEAPETHWSVKISKGILESVSCNGQAHQCSFMVDRGTFVDIVSGRLGPHKAFFDQRLDIEGDIEVGLKLAAVLTAFFKKFPFDPDRTETETA